MKSRVLQLINNFYYDEEENQSASEGWLGEFCVFGYYDGLRVVEEEEQNQPISDLSNRVMVNSLNGRYSVRNIGCVCFEDEKDKNFWNEAKKYPFLFVSMVRMKESARESWTEQIKIWNEKDTMISYYASDHNEVLLLFLQREYSAGLKTLVEIKKNKNVLRMYSIFAVWEDILNNDEKLNNVIEEEVEVRWEATIKSEVNLDKFMKELAEKVRVKKTEPENAGDEIPEEGTEHSIKNNNGSEQGNLYKKYSILGSKDVSIEMDKVSMRKLLKCYAMGEMLTHINPDYQEIFYNIKTLFLKEINWDE